MAWVRLDDQFPDHPKVIGLSDQAFRLHVTALCYCSAQLTDGRVTALLTRRLTWFVTDSNAVTNELVTAGLWERDGDDFIIHDYLEYNPSAEHVKAARKANADRQKRHRNVSNGNRNALRNALVTASPSPSPSPSEKREKASAPAPTVDTDPEFKKAVAKFDAAFGIGSLSGQAQLDFSALWPDLGNGRRAWVDDAIAVAKAYNARTPAYAVNVLAGAVKDNKRPGQRNETPRSQGRNQERDLAALVGLK